MAHHQGMSLLSLDSLLLDRPMQKRFESDPLFQATTLLLQERVPKATASYAIAAELSGVRTTPGVTEMPVRSFGTPTLPYRKCSLLSNGRYHVMVTNSGGGYSRWNGIAVTRWREDGTCDNWGTFCYLRDTASGGVLVHRVPADAQETGEVRGDFFGGAGGVPPPRPRFRNAHGSRRFARDDVEVRRVRIVNRLPDPQDG